MSIYKCPVCAEPLTIEKRRFVCANNHSFDRAKEGYVNLLLANQKNSADPGDSKAMVRARRDFFSGGYYAPLADALNTTITERLSDDFILLDVGCGEGYFLWALRESLDERACHLHGTDISKHAVRYAAKRDPASTFTVASIYDLPLLENSVDCLTRIFAPKSYSEFARVLKDDGTLITVVPANDHLREIKAIIYDTPEAHTPETDPERDTLFMEQDSIRVRYETTVTGNADIMNLLTMTPYYWHLSDDAKATFQQMDSLSITVDCLVSVYTKKH
ncbi:MAG: putative RNA methyltransferase [Chloroflexota bacterium]